MDDMESIFKVEEGKPFATVDNVPIVNEAIDHLRDLLTVSIELTFNGNTICRWLLQRHL